MASRVTPADTIGNFKHSKTEMAVQRAKEEREMPRQDRDGNCEKHLAAIRKCVCCIPGCNKVGVDPHHLKCVPGTRGMALRAPDKYSLPLCRAHHDDVEIHGIGPANELKWFAKHLILDPIGFALSLWNNARGDAPGILRIVMANKVSIKNDKA